LFVDGGVVGIESTDAGGSASPVSRVEENRQIFDDGDGERGITSRHLCETDRVTDKINMYQGTIAVSPWT
jgi:hypothetical protein